MEGSVGEVFIPEGAGRQSDGRVQVQRGPDARQRGDQPEPGLGRDAHPPRPHFGRSQSGQDRTVLAPERTAVDRSAATVSGTTPCRRGERSRGHRVPSVRRASRQVLPSTATAHYRLRASTGPAGHGSRARYPPMARRWPAGTPPAAIRARSGQAGPGRRPGRRQGGHAGAVQWIWLCPRLPRTSCSGRRRGSAGWRRPGWPHGSCRCRRHLDLQRTPSPVINAALNWLGCDLT